jgi:predicted GNAT family acetyltransferase
MMICFKPMHRLQIPLPVGYALRVEKDQAVSVVRVIHDHVIVAIGRVVLVDGYIIYDRIETSAEHRRKGLATIIMLELEAMALAQGGTKGVLVATTEGKNLYEKLGWEMYTEYTTAVIPGPEGHV